MSSVASSRFIIAGLFLFCVLASCAAEAKRARCVNEECDLKQEHFDLYSTIKRAVDADFYMKGKDIIPLIRSTQVLSLRFSGNENQTTRPKLNGTKLVAELLSNKRLMRALEVFTSDQGRDLINLYKTSINGNQQNLACSKWRIAEIEQGARKLKSDPKLAEVFGNIHKNFVERSARKCLKSSCSSIDENMNHLNAILRQPGRRKGFIAREDVTGKLYEESSLSTNALDELMEDQVESEPAKEFQQEELELCHFFKRTNATKCRASGNELSEISFLKSVKVNNETVQSSFDDFLADYTRHKSVGELASNAGDERETLLGKCRTLRPALEFHLYGLRWYQSKELISSDKLRSRTFWCPSLSYWLEVERLCGELMDKLTPSNDAADQANDESKPSAGIFSY